MLNEFNMMFVLQEDLPFERKFKSGDGYDMDCPFCKGKRKFHVSLKRNAARCNKCSGDSGWNTTTLHADLTGLSTKEAYKDLVKKFNGLEAGAKVIAKHTKKLQEEDSITPVDITVRDKVYRKLLESLELAPSHKEDLLKRGLSEEDIKEGLYKTVPVMGFHSLAVSALEGEKIKKGEGIPGFTDASNINDAAVRKKKSGYFVPVKTRNGLISGMQIRFDNLPENSSEEEKEAFRKYTWFSSAEKDTGCGVTGCENIHYAGNWEEVPKEVQITEGMLKADIASHLSGKPFLALAGVNNVGQLQAELTKLQKEGLETVNICVDMDYREKREVANAMKRIQEIINKSGFHEYILSDKEIRMKEAEKAVVINFKEKTLPKKVVVYIDHKPLEDSSFCFTKDNTLFIKKDEITELRNGETHLIGIADATKFELKNVDDEETKKKILGKNTYAAFTFEKRGLMYKNCTWDEDYKGIDDYLLARKEGRR